MDHLKLYRSFQAFLSNSSYLEKNYCVFCCEFENKTVTLENTDGKLNSCLFCFENVNKYLNIIDMEFLGLIYLARKYKREKKFCILKSKYNSLISYEIAKYA